MTESSGISQSLDRSRSCSPLKVDQWPLAVMCFLTAEGNDKCQTCWDPDPISNREGLWGHPWLIPVCCWRHWFYMISLDHFESGVRLVVELCICISINIYRYTPYITQLLCCMYIHIQSGTALMLLRKCWYDPWRTMDDGSITVPQN